MSTESVPSQKAQANSEYCQRINRVIDHIRENLDRQMKLEELAGVACFSEFHFHRIFSAVTGETLSNFTNRLRLERAARLLRYSSRTLTDIAFACGFSSSATFSRAFRSGCYAAKPEAARNHSGLLADPCAAAHCGRRSLVHVLANRQAAKSGFGSRFTSG